MRAWIHARMRYHSGMGEDRRPQAGDLRFDRPPSGRDVEAFYEVQPDQERQAEADGQERKAVEVVRRR
jgi:hypothetical protein